MRIPVNAKQVFKGVIFDVYQWPQKMYDGSLATFEMLKRPNTIEIIPIQDNKILLSAQSQPTKTNFYSLFGGRSEPDEEPLVTAKRELLEESGLKSNDWELYRIYEPFHKIDWQIYTYIARNCINAGQQQLDSGEKIEVIKCTFDEFVEIVLSDKYWGNELALDICKKLRNPTELSTFKQKLFG